MKHLSGLDATFLHLETPETPMHVGSIQLLTLPPGFEGDFAERVKSFVGSRLHLADVFQRKLALMPFDIANPAWIDDHDVDLDYHIRRVTLPRPGTMKQLEQYVARLHSSLLDRSRPLWEFYVIDGLQSGQVGFYSKVHHAGIDGQAGVALARALLDTTPEPRVVKPPRPRRRDTDYQLGVAELLGAAIRNTAAQYVTVAKTLPAAAKALVALATRRKDAATADVDAADEGDAPKPRRLGLSPRTPLNVAITNQRAFAGRLVPLAELKQMARASKVSLNDLVLAECAGALKRFLAEEDCVPTKALTAAVPISLRSEGDTQANNQVSGMVVSLATDIADPIERLRAIHASANAAKGMTGFLKALPTDLPALGAPWLMSGLASLYGRSRIADRLPPLANVAISNVPGPPVPLYLAGALVDSYVPVSIVTHGLALNITVQSYNGMLAYGLTACRRAVPDVAMLADYIVDEHRRLAARIAAQAEQPAVDKPAVDKPGAATAAAKTAAVLKPVTRQTAAKAPAAKTPAANPVVAKKGAAAKASAAAQESAVAKKSAAAKKPSGAKKPSAAKAPSGARKPSGAKKPSAAKEPAARKSATGAPAARQPGAVRTAAVAPATRKSPARASTTTVSSTPAPEGGVPDAVATTPSAVASSSQATD